MAKGRSFGPQTKKQFEKAQKKAARRRNKKNGGGSATAIVLRNASIPSVRQNGGIDIANRSARSTIRLSLVKQVCSMLDPFCPEAKGARLPDGGGSRTFTYQSRQVNSLVSGHLGKVGLQIYTPATTSAGYFGSTTDNASNQVTVMSALLNSDPQLATALASASAARIVSAGIRYWSTQPSTATGGLVVVTVGDDFTQLINKSGLTIDPTVVSGVGATSMTFDSRKEFTVVLAPKDTQSNMFQRTTNPTATSNPYYPFEQVAVGFKTANIDETIGFIEYIINYEYEVLSTNGTTWGGSVLPNMGTPAPSANPKVMSARDTVAKNLESIYDGGVELLERAVRNRATAAITALADNTTGLITAALAAM